MSAQLGKVVSLIILERFGSVVEKVVSYLFRYGTSPLLYIQKYTELPLSKVFANSLIIKYLFVYFNFRSKNRYAF